MENVREANEGEGELLRQLQEVRPSLMPFRAAAGPQALSLVGVRAPFRGRADAGEQGVVDDVYD